MSETYHQKFRQSIQLSVRMPKTFAVAFKSIEDAVNQLNIDLQRQLEHKQLYQPADFDFNREAVVVNNPVIVSLELYFLRDTGKFNGCTGETMGQHENRYHSLVLDVAFKNP